MNWKHGAGKQHLSGPGGGPTWLVEMFLFLTSYQKMDSMPHPLHWSHDLLNRTFAKGDAFDWTLRLSTHSYPQNPSQITIAYLAWSSWQQEKDSLPVNYSSTRRLLHEINPKGIKSPSDSLSLDIRFHSSRNALTISRTTASIKLVLHSFSPFAPLTWKVQQWSIFITCHWFELVETIFQNLSFFYYITLQIPPQTPNSKCSRHFILLLRTLQHLEPNKVGYSCNKMYCLVGLLVLIYQPGPDKGKFKKLSLKEPCLWAPFSFSDPFQPKCWLFAPKKTKKANVEQK